MVKNYQPEHYPNSKAIIPHGLSVVMTAPAVFNFTGPMCPDRHLKGAAALGGDTSKAKAADAGAVLADVVRDLMDKAKIPNGISALGYGKADIPALVKGALPQERVNKLAPRPQVEQDLHDMYEKSLTVY
jgi:hydroxyacid-oxoacid transhydrogenase